MKIEVLCQETDSTKDKGDLLEALSKDLLESQSYEVIEEIRVTGAELDLLCKHKVSSKQIYVECKAQKDKIGAPVLRQLNGTVDAYDYSEGWLISTAEFGKEAKGFVEMWKKKPTEKSSKLSFYTPELIVQSLISASIIKAFPEREAIKLVGKPTSLGDWN
ncbi:MAG: restriction endonuclease, partial [Maricaulaceae bacterium]